MPYPELRCASTLCGIHCATIRASRNSAKRNQSEDRQLLRRAETAQRLIQMTVFEHVTALFSFVYALALTHLLARIAELIVARDRVKFSGLLALGMVNAIILVFANWLSLWDLHAITSWNLASITVQFLFAVNVFLICVLVGPKAHDDGPIDLEDVFWRQRPYFYGALVACAVLSLFANLDYLKTANAALFLKENLTVLPMFIPTLAALVSRKRWIQWAAGLCYLVMILGYTIAFCGTLS